jgi:hypothetical protein
MGAMTSGLCTLKLIQCPEVISSARTLARTLERQVNALASGTNFTQQLGLRGTELGAECGSLT